MTRRPDLVLLGDRIWYSPDGVLDLQCIARTRRGPRCRRTVETGQITGWTELPSIHGLITVYDLGGFEAATLRRWREQHCELHDTPDVVDFSAPEWEPFDPVRHATMVTTLDEQIAKFTRQLREGVTEEWQPWYPAPI